MGQMLSKCVNRHQFTCMLVNSGLPVPNPISSFSRNAGLSMSFTNSLMFLNICKGLHCTNLKNKEVFVNLKLEPFDYGGNHFNVLRITTSIRQKCSNFRSENCFIHQINAVNMV